MLELVEVIKTSELSGLFVDESSHFPAVSLWSGLSSTALCSVCHSRDCLEGPHGQETVVGKALVTGRNLERDQAYVGGPGGRRRHRSDTRVMRQSVVQSWSHTELEPQPPHPSDHQHSEHF